MLAWGKVERSHLVNGVSMLETTQVEPESACPIKRMQTQSTADPAINMSPNSALSPLPIGKGELTKPPPRPAMCTEPRGSPMHRARR